MQSSQGKLRAPTSYSGRLRANSWPHCLQRYQSLASSCCRICASQTSQSLWHSGHVRDSVFLDEALCSGGCVISADMLVPIRFDEAVHRAGRACSGKCRQHITHAWSVKRGYICSGLMLDRRRDEFGRCSDAGFNGSATPTVHGITYRVITEPEPLCLLSALATGGQP